MNPAPVPASGQGIKRRRNGSGVRGTLHGQKEADGLGRPEFTGRVFKSNVERVGVRL